MDAYSKILTGTKLYSLEIIEQFGKRHPKWHSMTGREKENHLLHIMLCMLLSNRERVGENIETRKGRRKTDQGEQLKRPRTTDYLQAGTISSTMTLTTNAESASGSRSTETSSTTEDDVVLEDDVDDAENYRFIMINHMPLKDITTKDICEQWGNIPEISYPWDVADIQERKFVRVRYSYNNEKDIQQYLRAKTEVPMNSDMFIIDAGTTQGVWVDGNPKAKGEEKVTKFLLERQMVFESAGINDNLYLPPMNPMTLFPSGWVKEELAKWEEDLLKDQSNNYTESELYCKESPPKTITPSDLLKELEDIVESTNPGDCIKWKGKIMPEPICANITTRESLDSDIITQFLSTVKNSISKENQIERINMKEDSSLEGNILVDVIDIWEDSDKNTFSFMERTNYSKGKIIKDSLGIGKKGITYSGIIHDMKQPEYKENRKLRYSPWIEEIFTSMAERDKLPLGYTPCPELLIQSNTDDHPLPTICEPTTTEILDVYVLLNTNMGIQISKLTNLYSRLGGAYGSGEIRGKEMFKNIAIFPILATLSNRMRVDCPEEEEDKLRLVSGIVIRSPYHARRPTDRIMILTIEIVEKTAKNYLFLQFVNNCLLYKTNDFFVVVRQNAVMKEDATYNSFVTTALFTPINMLGCMTLENPMVTRGENMKLLMENTVVRYFTDYIFTDFCFK